MKLAREELSVLRLLLLGQPDAGVAFFLSMPIDDARRRRESLLRKFGVNGFLKRLRACGDDDQAVRTKSSEDIAAGDGCVVKIARCTRAKKTSSRPATDPQQTEPKAPRAEAVDYAAGG